jgi:hypothetical protein
VAQGGTGLQPVTEIPAGNIPVRRIDSPRPCASGKVWLTDILFAIGFCGYGAATLSAVNWRAGKWKQGKGLRFSGRPRHRS